MPHTRPLLAMIPLLLAGITTPAAAQKAGGQQSQPAPSSPRAGEKYLEEGLSASDRLLIQNVRRLTTVKDDKDQAVYGEVNFDRILKDGHLSDNERRLLTRLAGSLGEAGPLRDQLTDQQERIARLRNRILSGKTDADGSDPIGEIRLLNDKIQRLKESYEPKREQIRLTIRQINGTLGE